MIAELKKHLITGLYLLLLLCAFASAPAAAQTITEIIDSTGDGAGKPLDGPQDIAVDGSGNAYVLGKRSHNAFKITPGGVITEILDATGDGAGNTFRFGRFIAVDDSSINIYITGGDNNVFEITPSGAITEIIDTSDTGGEAVSFIDVDGNGNIYLGTWGSEHVFKITPARVVTEIFDANGDGGGNILHRIGGIAVDGPGNVYVTGFSSDNAFKITPGGVITQIIDITGDGTHIMEQPNGIAVDGSGNVYVTGLFSDNAFKITPGGIITQIIDATGDGTYPLNQVTHIAVDSFENVYVTGIQYAFKITPGGIITKIIDSTGDGAGNPFIAPTGIAVDGSGNAYVIGRSSDNAFKITLANPVPELTCHGFAPPFDQPISLKKKVKRAIPIDMILTDADGSLVTDAEIIAPPVINIYFEGQVFGEVPPDTDELLPLGSANDDNVFRFDLDSGQWIYNLGTKQFMAPGTYTVLVSSGDETEYTIDACFQTFERLP